jgi:regulator of replication initiation timing
VARQHAEENIKQLQTDLCAAQMHTGKLEQENPQLSSKVRRLKKRMGHSQKEVNKALSALRRSSSAARTCSEDKIQVESRIEPSIGIE